MERTYHSENLLFAITLSPLMNDRLQALRTIERLETGLELRESHFREFKSALDHSTTPPTNREVKLICKDIAETLVAFANADGGELFVGVEDDARVTGIHLKESLISVLVDAFKTHVHSDTPLPAPTVSRVSYQNKLVLYFHIAKSTTQVHLTSDGRCLQRFDRENRPVAAENIQYSRQEAISREYDRKFLDEVRLVDLDTDAIEEISRRIGGNQSPEKFLQFVDVAEYGADGLIVRRAAALLFAKEITRWHPRCQVRIVRVSGTELGHGKDYNVSSRDDQIVRGNILQILENAWDTLRPYLTQTKLVESGIFQETLVYPEDACREALVNAIAHRDYSIEGKGIEIFIYDDRLEVHSPGGLLSSISIKDLTSGVKTHQSRNAYIARVLRELGWMREMGEGMLRIYSTMKNKDLAPPELIADSSRFDLVLHHRSVFSPKDQEWLRAYSHYSLDRDEQRVVLLGRSGQMLSTKAIIAALGIVDTEEFRKLVQALRRKGILYNALDRASTQKAFNKAGSKRAVPRFMVRPPDQADQYRLELISSLAKLPRQAAYAPEALRAIAARLTESNPYKESLSHSCQLLGLLDERLRPLPQLTVMLDRFERSGLPPIGLGDGSKKSQPDVTGPEQLQLDMRDREKKVDSSQINRRTEPLTTDLKDGEILGTVINIRFSEGYAFARAGESEHFFRKIDLMNIEQWRDVRKGALVAFRLGEVRIPGKAPAAKDVRLIPLRN